MRRFLIAGNWKMHGSLSMTSELINGIVSGLGQVSAAEGMASVEVLVCPPSAYLATAKAAAANSQVRVGAQNVHAEPQGAFTGEVALPMLSDLGCDYVLLGHSERREMFAEDDAVIAGKFAACVGSDAGVIPVLCLGETLEQRQAGTTEQVLAEQLDAVLAKVGVQGFKNAVIAYEPVWAIGTGETATPEQAQSAHAFLRNRLASHDATIAERVQILYGGSMKPENAKDLLSQPDIDGGLIGGASLKSDSFVAICAAAAELVSA